MSKGTATLKATDFVYALDEDWDDEFQTLLEDQVFKDHKVDRDTFYPMATRLVWDFKSGEMTVDWIMQREGQETVWE